MSVAVPTAVDLPEFEASLATPGAAKHERLRDYFVAQIAEGRLLPGALLPSEQRIAETLQIARSTVRQAMSTLEREGFVRRIHGKGTFVHEHAAAPHSTEKGHDLFALIVPETRVGFYPALQRSFEDAAADLHNQVIVCNSDNDIDKQGNSILQFIDHRVAGVAIVPTTVPPTPAFHLRQLQRNGIPVVCCSRRVDGVQAPLLAIPFEEVGRRAGEAMRDAGHRRVAMISGDRTPAAEAYERGFRDAFRDSPDASIRIFYGSVHSPELSAHEAELSGHLDSLFAGGQPPTAIFVSFDSLAELIFVLLAKRGIRVPEDVSLLGFGGVRRQGALSRQLTSITIDEEKLGQEAVALLDQMRRGELPIENNETRWIRVGMSDGVTLAKLKTETRRARSGQAG
ncbi:MAG TPA: GntR family transcriptional regulator [Caulifigura sp.]|jgi:DNA-binding LacI/PurR family transcriptional regulator|nr:GntR family transcriptional regulator [Caulifigura sp.]